MMNGPELKLASNFVTAQNALSENTYAKSFRTTPSPSILTGAAMHRPMAIIAEAAFVALGESSLKLALTAGNLPGDTGLRRKRLESKR